MLRSAAWIVQTIVIDLSSDDHGSCPDVFGGPEYSCMHRSLFYLDLYLGRFPSRHRSNALQKRVADGSLQIIELQSVVKMQLRKQGLHSEDLGEDMTDKKFNMVRARNGIRLTKELFGSFIEIHRSKNWALDLKHDFLFSEKVGEIPLNPLIVICFFLQVAEWMKSWEKSAGIMLVIIRDRALPALIVASMRRMTTSGLAKRRRKVSKPAKRDSWTMLFGP
jgi:hypothetical protein